MEKRLRSKRTGVIFGYSQEMFDTGSYDLMTMEPAKKPRRKRTAKPKAVAKDTQPIGIVVSEFNDEQDDS